LPSDAAAQPWAADAADAAADEVIEYGAALLRLLAAAFDVVDGARSRRRIAVR
jgi:hypothetical protein